MSLIQFVKHLAKHLFALTVGNFLIHLNVGRFGGYVGRQKIYKQMQMKHPDIFSRSLIYTINNPIKHMKQTIQNDWMFLKDNINNTRLSTAVVSQYSTESLMGYGDKEYDKGGVLLKEQQRGQILPFIEKYCASQDGLMICEIGTGNGDLVADLSKKFKSNNFIGVDFGVKNAQEKYQDKNLKFIDGYAMDALKNIHLDVVFTCSTACLFTPLELKSYLSMLSKNGTTDIFINEPSWGGFHSEEGGEIYSSHLEGALWFHNYPAYFKEFGYEVKELKTNPYQHPKSLRPDIWLNLIHFKKAV